MVPGPRSPFACPELNCTFRDKTKEGVGDHLGRRHMEVVITLVRQTFPDFSSIKPDSGDMTKAVDGSITHDEILVPGGSSQVKNAEFVSCGIASGQSKLPSGCSQNTRDPGKVRPNPLREERTNEDGVPTVDPPGSSMERPEETGVTPCSTHFSWSRAEEGSGSLQKERFPRRTDASPGSTRWATL